MQRVQHGRLVLVKKSYTSIGCCRRDLYCKILHCRLGGISMTLLTHVTTHNQAGVVQVHQYNVIREGFKKKCEKVSSFAKPPSDPPPGLVIFPEKKLTPIVCFFRNKTLIAWNKFYTWSHLKIYSFYYFIVLWYWPSFPQDLGRSGYFQSCPNSCRYEIGTPDQV